MLQLHYTTTKIVFCLGEQMLWRMGDNGPKYELTCGDSTLYKQGKGISTHGTIYAGQRLWGISIEFDKNALINLIHQRDLNNKNEAFLLDGKGFYSAKISPSIRLILNEIIECRYRDQIKRIYMEGKILEILALYLEEIIFEKSIYHSMTQLSSIDLEALQQAKKLLDANIANPPTLAQLAKQVYSNEYKLKTGFKKLFGTSIHAYIIEKRLEMARFLLGNHQLRITDVALLVGYHDLSYFAEMFRRKYHMKPSEYSKKIKQLAPLHKKEFFLDDQSALP